MWNFTTIFLVSLGFIVLLVERHHLRQRHADLRKGFEFLEEELRKLQRQLHPHRPILMTDPTSDRPGHVLNILQQPPLELPSQNNGTATAPLSPPPNAAALLQKSPFADVTMPGPPGPLSTIAKGSASGGSVPKPAQDRFGVGDILRLPDYATAGGFRVWKVTGIYPGALGHESTVCVKPLDAEPDVQEMHIPEIILMAAHPEKV